MPALFEHAYARGTGNPGPPVHGPGCLIGDFLPCARPRSAPEPEEKDEEEEGGSRPPPPVDSPRKRDEGQQGTWTTNRKWARVWRPRHEGNRRAPGLHGKDTLHRPTGIVVGADPRLQCRRLVLSSRQLPRPHPRSRLRDDGPRGSSPVHVARLGLCLSEDRHMA